MYFTNRRYKYFIEHIGDLEKKHFFIFLNGINMFFIKKKLLIAIKALKLIYVSKFYNILIWIDILSLSWSILYFGINFISNMFVYMCLRQSIIMYLTNIWM